MEIDEVIYECSVEPSYLKTTIVYSNHDGHSRQIRGVAVSSKAYSEVGNHSGNIKQSYVDCPRDRSKLTCIIHGNVHSS